MRERATLRIFHLPALVGNHGPSLARLERDLGHRSTSIAEYGHPFGFDADVTLLRPGEGPWRMEFRRWRWFLRILREADVVHYNWGRTFFPDIRPRPSPMERGLPSIVRWAYRAYGRAMASVELVALRLRGIRIVVTFQGNDARQADRCRSRGAVRVAMAMPADEWTAPDDRWVRRMVARFARHAHAVFALNPDLLLELPGRATFLPYLHWDPRGAHARTNGSAGRLVVGHAPSVRAAKGTDELIRAIESLRDDGQQVELRLIEGRSHRECIAAMSGCDIFVDQLLYGWYGGAAVESMSMGIPTVACIDAESMQLVPAAFRADCPVIHADPGSIRATLAELIHMSPAERSAIGARSREFALRWHDPQALVLRVLASYRRQ